MRLERSLRDDAMPLAGLFVAWCGLMALFQFTIPALHGIDSYFHVAVAEKMAKFGFMLKSFPWVTQSVWVDHYFDKEWLFHVALRVSLLAGPFVGPKLLMIAGIGLAGVAMWYCAQRLRIARPFWWLMLIPICGQGLWWNRMLEIRPHVFSQVFIFICFGAMLQRRKPLLAIATFIYALSYTGHWQMIGLAFAADMFWSVFDDDGHWRKRPEWSLSMTFTVVGVVALAAVIHPNFPANITGLYIQNIRVIKDYNIGGNPLMSSRPYEIRPFDLGDMVPVMAPLLLTLVGIFAHAAQVLKRRGTQPRYLLLFGAYTLLYLLLMWRMKRFAEYFVPVSVLFIAAYMQYHGLLAAIRKRSVKVLGVAVLLLLGVVALWGSYAENVVQPNRHGLSGVPHAGAAAWIREHLEPGEVVFATSWSDTPMLFYGAPEQRELVFLDPMFMYARDPGVYLNWDAIRKGRVDDAQVVDWIRRDFQSRLVFLYKPDPEIAAMAAQLQAANPGVDISGYLPVDDHLAVLPLYAQLLRDPRAKLVYDDGPRNEVLFLLDGEPIVPPAASLVPHLGDDSDKPSETTASDDMDGFTVPTRSSSRNSRSTSPSLTPTPTPGVDAGSGASADAFEVPEAIRRLRETYPTTNGSPGVDPDEAEWERLKQEKLREIREAIQRRAESATPTTTPPTNTAAPEPTPAPAPTPKDATGTAP